MMRLDSFLYENNYTASRTEAKNFITEGAVSVDGKIIKKPSYEVEDNSQISIDKSSKKYVSRGGTKLEAAIERFNVLIKDKDAIDIGASTGGFTDCLLKCGARRVICVDSGTNQLHVSLRCDTRITVMENCNARYLEEGDLPYTPSLAVMDVSFISATAIIGAIYNVLSDNADFICLIKPQFEVGKSGLGKGGIVKNQRLRDEAVKKVIEYAKSQGFIFVDKIESPIAGGDGNIEYLAHFRKAVML